MKVSLMIHTASYDFFLKDQGINSYFQSVVDCLNEQSINDFELVYIDTFYELNKNSFEKVKSNFLIKHVPIHDNHKYWFDLGYVYISAAKNTGILYADGELLITCDDGELFDINFIKNYWNYYKKENKFLSAKHKRMKSINTHDGKILLPLNGDIYINDYRFEKFKNIYYHNHGSLTYAGSSFSLDMALKLNGFNEKMDGCKSLEDCDFGTRLSMAGAEFVLDSECFLYIINHQHYSDLIHSSPEDKLGCFGKKIDSFIAVENYGVLRASVELSEIKSNESQLSNEHYKIIQRETLKFRGFDPLSESNKSKMDIWMKTPNFDLKKERIELRKSSKWRW